MQKPRSTLNHSGDFFDVKTTEVFFDFNRVFNLTFKQLVFGNVKNLPHIFMRPVVEQGFFVAVDFGFHFGISLVGM
ncbi:MAG TPA: hypothetical protein DEB47_22630 [Citreicella sp.]|nr:hypothetical protein [Citreicella sp.]